MSVQTLKTVLRLSATVLLVALFSQAGQSAEPVPEKPQATQQGSEQAASDDTGQKPAKAVSKTPNDPTFNPTEEISEDLSVPFPVDI